MQNAPKMTKEEAAQLGQYMAEVKSALKTMSKNELIRTVGALLLDKQLMMQEINRLNSQNGVPSETNPIDGATGTAPDSQS